MTAPASQLAFFPTDSRENKKGDFETAVEEMFNDLDARGVLDPVSRAKRAGLVAAARQCDTGFAAARVSVATSTVFKTVMDALDALPKVAANKDNDLNALQRTLAALTDKALA